MISDLDPDLTADQSEDIEVIDTSGLFDTDYYLRSNPDVAKQRMHPLVHFVRHGADEGRNPNDVFVVKQYLRGRGDSVPLGRNAFAHFIMHGSDDDLFDRGLLTVFEVPTLRRGIGRLQRLPIYSDEKYLEMNSDVSRLSRPLDEHAFLYGFPEGRSVLNSLVVAESLGRFASMDERSRPPPTWATATEPAMPTKPAAVYYNSLGNGFIKEIAADLVASLAAAGFDAVLLDQTAEVADRRPVSIVMAPHEFFHLGRGRDWAIDSVVSQAFMFNTEQLQTVWFERGLPFMLMSRGILDICCQVASMFDDSGVRALHFSPDIAPPDIDHPNGWLLPADEEHSMIRVLPPAARTRPSPGTPFDQRPIDVSFFGGTSEHREAFFVRHARYLSNLETYLYYRRFDGPQKNTKRDGILSRLGAHVTAHSKISLNIHRDDYGFFEWHRIVKMAMAGGSVVVTEPCLPHPLFKPDQHFFEESGRHIPDLLEWLLHTDDGRARAEEVRRDALALVHDRLTTEQAHRNLRSFLLEGVTA